MKNGRQLLLLGVQREDEACDEESTGAFGGTRHQDGGRFSNSDLESKRLEGFFYSLVDAQHAIPIDDQKYDVDEAAMGYTEEFFCTEKLAQSGIGDIMDDQEKLVVLLRCLSENYKQIKMIIENMHGIDLMIAREIIRKMSKQKVQQSSSQRERVQWKMFKCRKRGHKQDDCYQRNNQKRDSSRNDHAFMATTAQYKKYWLLDSGASSHMSYDKSELESMRNLDSSVKISITNGTTIEAVSTGSIPVSLNNGENVTIHDVLYVPKLDRRLLPITALVARGINVSFGNKWCEIHSGIKTIIRIQRSGKMYILNTLPKASTETASAASSSEGSQNWDIWHARLGHLPFTQIERMQKCATGVQVKELPIYDDDDQYDVCGGCAKGKLSVKSFPKSKINEA
uniref:Putative polyprotein n=1 Tax=Albugo laibachii Nc14 TaxID=890382 RepID=F0WXG5_9STRA|nr:putative polyprotein [Albugo laibachii Nc14]|eukprot:CCA26158.1 putative polyprotein [Albugo laibachii Nc14]